MKSGNDRIEIVEPEEGEIFDIELDINLLKENERLAQENRATFEKYGIKAIDVMGSIGSGKTSLIEHMVQRLKDRYRITVLNGDLTTTIDAERISRHGVNVMQINTGKECHLDANLVKKALQRIDLEETDLLIIENVGNLICPGEFPLGSEKRVVVTSVTEGPYMIVKHPFIFSGADVIVINKVDLAEAMGVDIDKLEEDAEKVAPRAKVVRANCRSGMGVGEVIKALNL